MMAWQCNGAIVMVPMESYGMWAEPRPDIFRKTKMCTFFQQGNCQRGAACAFAHGQVELNTKPDLSKTKMCPYMNKAGQCPHGPECTFAHKEVDLRKGVDHNSNYQAQTAQMYNSQMYNPQMYYGGMMGLPMSGYYMEPYEGEEAVTEQMEAALRKHQHCEELSGTSSEEQASRSTSDDDQEAPARTDMKARQERIVRPVAKLSVDRPVSTTSAGSKKNRQFSRSTVDGSDSLFSNDSDDEQDGNVRWCDLTSGDEDEGWDFLPPTKKGEEVVKSTRVAKKVEECHDEIDIAVESPFIGA